MSFGDLRYPNNAVLYMGTVNSNDANITDATITNITVQNIDTVDIIAKTVEVKNNSNVTTISLTGTTGDINCQDLTALGDIGAGNSLSGNHITSSTYINTATLAATGLITGVKPIGYSSGATSQTVTADGNYYAVSIFNVISGSAFVTGGVTFSSQTYFTVPIAGKYNVSACLNLSSAGTGNVTITLQKNGSVYGNFLVSLVDNNTTFPTFSQFMNLAANDQVQLAVNNGTGSNLTITGGFFSPPSASSSWFQIFYVGN